MAPPEIDEKALRTVLADQHPDLANLPLCEVNGGWGNQMWRLGDDLAVRVQRMNSTANRQLKERRWLPVLAPRLPLPIPLPVREGVATPRLPKIWTVMTWVPGEPLDRSEITQPEAGAALAGFLTALHVPAPADAPADTEGRSAHPKDCRDGFEHFTRALDPTALGPFRDRMDQVWHEAVTAPE